MRVEGGEWERWEAEGGARKEEGGGEEGEAEEREEPGFLREEAGVVGNRRHDDGLAEGEPAVGGVGARDEDGGLGGGRHVDGAPRKPGAARGHEGGEDALIADGDEGERGAGGAEVAGGLDFPEAGAGRERSAAPFARGEERAHGAMRKRGSGGGRGCGVAEIRNGERRADAGGEERAEGGALEELGEPGGVGKGDRLLGEGGDVGLEDEGVDVAFVGEVFGSEARIYRTDGRRATVGYVRV